MEQVRDLLRHAGECLAMAIKTRNPKTKARLESLAKKWQQLAAEREKFLKSSGPSQKR